MYAKRMWGAKGNDKKHIALDVGYSPSVANSTKSKIENHPGFNNAIAALAHESNNMAMAAMAEFKARGLRDFSNKDLVGALNAIAGAWGKFNAEGRGAPKIPENKNRLRTVILQRIENQTISAPAEIREASTKDVDNIEEDVDNIFDDEPVVEEDPGF